MSNNIKPLKEGVRKNNQEKPNPVVKKSDVAKPPAAISNNKQNMKLYTEEQVISVFEKYGNMSAINARNILDLSEPIELPSDEEINDQAHKVHDDTFNEFYAFEDGAKWMRNKTQGGNK